MAALADRRVRSESENLAQFLRRNATQGGLRLDDVGAPHVVRKGTHANEAAGLRGRRKDKIWTEQDIAAILAVASDEIKVALILALWSGQRQGDLLRLSWSVYESSYTRVATKTISEGMSLLEHVALKLREVRPLG